jgi:hypothetical protein
MSIDWHWVANAVLGSGVVGLGWRNAKARGAQEERLKEMGELIIDHGATLATHTAQLAKGEGNFNVIDAKLEAIKEGVTGLGETQKETNRLIINHIIRPSERDGGRDE